METLTRSVVDPLKLTPHSVGKISVESEFKATNIIQVRSNDEFADHAVFLPTQFKYRLGKDSRGLKILVVERR